MYRLDGKPWVSMTSAIAWKLDAVPSSTGHILSARQTRQMTCYYTGQITCS